MSDQAAPAFWRTGQFIASVVAASTASVLALGLLDLNVAEAIPFVVSVGAALLTFAFSAIAWRQAEETKQAIAEVQEPAALDALVERVEIATSLLREDLDNARSLIRRISLEADPDALPDQIEELERLRTRLEAQQRLTETLVQELQTEADRIKERYDLAGSSEAETLDLEIDLLEAGRLQMSHFVWLLEQAQARTSQRDRSWLDRLAYMLDA